MQSQILGDKKLEKHYHTKVISETMSVFDKKIRTVIQLKPIVHTLPELDVPIKSL